MMTYATIRRDYQSHARVENIFVDHYAKLISPFFTRLLVRANATPNRVTLLMMIAGIIGAALFAIPQTYCKILGLLMIHVWYILDCSDGEVARITKTFSKFGKEMDYTAHVVNHPLFNLAFVMTLISLSRYDTRFLLTVAVICISAELVLRNLVGFDHIYNLKTEQSAVTGRNNGLLKEAAILSVNLFTLYPNFALMFPLVYFVDWHFGTSIALYYLLIQTLMTTLLAIWTTTKWVTKIVAA